ncbi:MAG TPA: glycosyltransferase family 39 protein, partial [Thermoanaerobaculia bacterium]|nr:glycosyltransferase family 39 protein [Thermoanaerobaculia bacterium]
MSSTPAPAPRWARTAGRALVALAFTLAAVRGSAVLDNTYHFGERFSLANVETLVADGSLRPANAFYPSLSYLPQAVVLAASQALHRLTGIAALSVFDPRAADGFSRTAYLLCRLLAALYAALGVLLLHRLARRLFDPMVALAAALFLAVTPAIIVTGSVFKPDILVLTLTVLAFDWAELALRQPERRRFLRAGAGVGLAVAAKYTGVGAALPLVIGG